MTTFTAQVEQKGPLTRALVSVATMAGYGMGTVRAHTDPPLQAMGRYFKSLGVPPEGFFMALHGLKEGIKLGKKEELFRRAKRQTDRAKRAAQKAGSLAWNGAGV